MGFNSVQSVFVCGNKSTVVKLRERFSFWLNVNEKLAVQIVTKFYQQDLCTQT